MTNELKPVTIYDANILPGGFRNFGGVKKRYNEDGKRRINIALPPDVANDMKAQGWNIRQLDPRDEGDDPTPIIEVEIKFGDYPPRITMITGGVRRKLEESELEILDWVRFLKADIIIRPYSWDVNGKQGVKAYLKTLFVTVDENSSLEAQYASIPEAHNAQLPNAYPDDSPFE